MIRWFAKNDLAANLLMVAILVAGVIIAFTKVPLEVRPTQEFPMVTVNAPYRGASPEEIERQVVVPIEQALEDISGVKGISSYCYQGSGRITLYMKDGVDPKEKLTEIERRVRSVRSLPAGVDTIQYNIPDTANYFEVISVVIQAKDQKMPLQDLTERAFEVRNALLALQDVNRAAVVGTSPREFAIRLKPEKLQSYGLTFDKVSSAIKNNSQESGAGMLKYATGRLSLRPGNTALTGEEFGAIPIPIGGGETLPLSDLAEINDGFQDELKEVFYDGKPALIVEIFQTREQSAITIAEAVKSFVKQREAQSGVSDISLHLWNDESYKIQGRLKTLGWSLFQGGILVMIILGLFLRPALAFWVVIGIPISFAGGVIFMPVFGITGNMMSIFAFILVLGIVVDDAIVTGENVFQKMQGGGDRLEAAVSGTKEVTTPVIFGVLTTIVAFIPLYSFDGMWGVLAKQIPPVVAPVLLFSLIESKLVLPGHLKHLNLQESSGRWYNIIPDWFNGKLMSFSEKVMGPLVKFCAHHRYATLALFLTVGLCCVGYWQSGRMGFQVFPTVDTNKITCTINMPTDSIYEDTKSKVEYVYAAAETLREEFRDGEGEDAPSLITGIVTSTGGHPAWGFNEQSGYVIIEILDPEVREVNFAKNAEIVERLRELCGEMDDVKSFNIRAQMASRKHSDEPDPLKIVIQGKMENEDVIDEVEDLVRAKIPKNELESLYDTMPKERMELDISLNEEGYRLGLTESTLAKHIKSSIIGTEITRIPRDTGEIKVFLRFSEEIQEDRYALDKLLITLNDGNTVPLSSIADVSPTYSPSLIEREGGSPVTSVIGSPKDKDYDLVKLAEELTPGLDKLLAQFPDLNWSFDGYLADYKEIRKRFLIGIIALFFTLFALLALPFNSLLQPFYVMLAVPFGIVGAFLGHIIMGITPSYMSMFGLLALSGVVVNDSLVLVDTINRLRKEGVPLKEAMLQGVTRRFRPILLTSMTTFVGLLPLMFAQSMQAQFLVPMAVSLGYGILFATFVTLILVPTILLIADDLQRLLRGAFRWWSKPFQN